MSRGSLVVTDYFISQAKWIGDKLIVQITPKPTPIYEITVSDKQSQRNVLRVFNDQGIDTNNSFIVNFDEKYIEAGEGYIIKTDNITSVQIIN